MRYFVYWLSFSILCSTVWVYNSFGSPLIEQIIMQIAFVNLSKASFPIVLMRLFVRDCIMYPLVFTGVIFTLESFIKIVFNNLVDKKEIHPKSDIFIIRIIKKIFVYNFHICLLIFSFIYLESTFSFHNYIISQFNRKISYINYVKPEEVEIIPNNPKNLILIYAESFEDILANSNYFERNLLEDLTKIQGIRFKKYNQLPGTGWTIAGVFSTQCGDYIKLDFLENKYFCLSDMLDNQGYYNVYLQGASLEFTYTGKFLKKHKYHEVYGREEWQAQGFNDFNEWGLYDDDLFKQAKLKLKELHAKNKPFNLTLLTVDSHCPRGYISEFCKERGAINYTDIIECSSNRIADFIKFVEESGYLEDTNIVIMGDHLYPIDQKMPVNISKSDRTIFNLFISKNDHIKNREDIIHFDIFPTIMKFIGFDVKGDKLGLGKSGF